MSFRLVPKSVTLNDLERRNGRYFAFFSPNSLALKIHVYFLPRKYSQKSLVFSNISLMAIFAEVTVNECIIKKHLRDRCEKAQI